MTRFFSNRSPESYAVANAIVGVLMAAVLTRIPALAFGTFRQMVVILLSADAVAYVVMKLVSMRTPRAGK